MTGTHQTIAHYRRTLQKKAAQWNCPRAFPEYLEPYIAGREAVEVLDIGSGPFCTLGTQYDTCRITMTAADVLAGRFNRIVEEAGLQLLVPVTYQHMERLTYEDGRFDLVHCRNAVDHTADPVTAIREMLRVCRTGGHVYLEHFRNEGESQKYRGQHQWNVDVQDGKCVLWNPQGSVSLSELFPALRAWCSGKRSVVAVIQK